MPSTFDQAASGVATGASFGPWGAAIGGAAGLISGLVGAGQKRKGQAILDGLKYPIEQIPQGVMDARKIAQMMANEGLPEETYARARQNIAANQNAALRAASDRRGGLMSLGSILKGSNDAYGNLDSQDANARMNNKRQLITANNNFGSWQDKIWNNNVKGKYLQDYAHGNALLGAGNQNLMGGLDKAAGAVGLFGGQGGFNGLFGGSGNSAGGYEYGSNTPTSYSDYLTYKRG